MDKQGEGKGNLDAEAEMYLKRLPENINEGLLIIDREARIVYANLNIARMFEVPVDFLVGKTIHELPLEQQEELVNLHLQRSRSGESTWFEFSWKKNDGSKGYCRFSSRPLLDENGNYEGTISIVNDITARKVYEIQTSFIYGLEEIVSWISADLINVDIDEIDERITQLLRDLCIYFDIEQSFVYYLDETGNSYVLRYHWEEDGYEIEEDFKRINFDNISIQNVNREPVVIYSEKDIPSEFVKVQEMIRSRGVKSIAWIPFFFGDKYEGFLGFTSFNREIDWEEELLNSLKLLGMIINNALKRKETVKILENEYNRLKEIDKFRTEFVMNATHELKTPLMSIFSAAELLKGGLDKMNAKERQAIVEVLYNGAVRLKNLVFELLDFTKMERQKMELDKTQVDLAQIIREVLEGLHMLTKEKDQRLHVKLPYTCKILADKKKIKQVISNLVINAIKNTPRGGNINVQLVNNQENVHLTVSDDGIGFTEEELKKLFNKFMKFDRKNVPESIDIQGTGLGLYLSKSIIDAHGGTIRAESKGRNSGSTFHVLFPAGDG